MKKKKRTGVRKRLLLLCFAVLAAAAAGGSVYAYLTDADTAVNNLTVGSVKTEITEEFPSPQTPVPGGRIIKKVAVENTGPNDCFVRVQLLFSDSDMFELCSVNYPSPESWTYSDGWWYYGKALACGETTAPLIDGLTIAEEAAAEDLSGFDIFVRQESVQTKGYEDAADAFKNRIDPEEMS